MQDLKELIFKLSENDCISNIETALNIAMNELSPFCDSVKKVNGGAVAEIEGEADYSLLIDAHIDEVGFTVTDISEDGFLTVSTAGGIDLRTLPAKKVKIHGKEDIIGTFCSIPPHLKSSEQKFNDISALKIDTALGEEAKNLISPGDAVTFFETPCALGENRVTGKALDNRVGVAVLICLAKRLSGKRPPVNVKLILSNMEELGLRGAKTAVYGQGAAEAIVVDTTFATAPDVSNDEGGDLGKGAMIGISPSLSKQVSDALINSAKQSDTAYAVEVMSGRTGTNADVISLNESGIKTSTLSVPIRNMHTCVEVADIRDIESAVDILYGYVMAGGIGNA